MTTNPVSASSSVPPAFSPPICSGKHKTRLLIGEGNFSFALALIHKHDQTAGHSSGNSLGRSIVATELKDKIHCYDCSVVESMAGLTISTLDSTHQEMLCDACELTTQRIAELKKTGVEIKLGVDGRKIHEIEEFRGRTFSRIHWNGPHDGSRFQDQTLPKIIKEFFQACRHMQKPKDRVHITLAQPMEKKDFYQGYVYGIAQAASAAGYKIVKKRIFNSARYPEYQHVQTNQNEKAAVTDQGLREFVFEKVTDEEMVTVYAACVKEGSPIFTKDITVQLIKLSDKPCAVKTKDYYQEPKTYYVCSSDDDSSDCEAPDEL